MLGLAQGHLYLLLYHTEIIPVLPICQTNFPAIFREMEFFALFQNFYVFIYSKIFRGTFIDVLRNPGWQTLSDDKLPAGHSRALPHMTWSASLKEVSFKVSMPDAGKTFLRTFFRLLLVSSSVHLYVAFVGKSPPRVTQCSLSILFYSFIVYCS